MNRRTPAGPVSAVVGVCGNPSAPTGEDGDEEEEENDDDGEVMNMGGATPPLEEAVEATFRPAPAPPTAV